MHYQVSFNVIPGEMKCDQFIKDLSGWKI